MRSRSSRMLVSLPRFREGTARPSLTPFCSWLLGLLLLTPLRTEAQPRAEVEPPNPYRILDQLGDTLSIVERDYFEPVDTDRLTEGALRGLVSGLDPHSAYFSSEDLEIFEGDTSGRFGGIGVEVDFERDEIRVIAPIEGSPAARVGLAPGDVITAIDGYSVQDKKPAELVRSMRGPLGTKVRITVRKLGQVTLQTYELAREEIRVKSVRALLLDGDVAYIRIKSFQEGTHTEILEAFRELKKGAPELSGVLLDLRNNPGGLVREAAAVADEFLSSGTIYTTRHRKLLLRQAEAQRGGAFTQGALVVLINEYSASAAELLAGALKDQGRARLVGARSFGKGSVQTVLPLADGAALKLTTALYFTPSGKTLQALGVDPHVTIASEAENLGTGRVLREADLAGHIPGESPSEEDAETSPTRPSAPPSNDELHLGVARTIPTDPRTSSDAALRIGYEIVRGIWRGTASPLTPPDPKAPRE